MMEERQTVPGGAGPLLAVVINSFGVVLMSASGLRDLRHFQRALCIF